MRQRVVWFCGKQWRRSVRNQTWTAGQQQKQDTDESPGCRSASNGHQSVNPDKSEWLSLPSGFIYGANLYFNKSNTFIVSAIESSHLDCEKGVGKSPNLNMSCSLHGFVWNGIIIFELWKCEWQSQNNHFSWVKTINLEKRKKLGTILSAN